MSVVLKPEDTNTAWPLLLAASGYAAMERDSELVDLRDLLKAIYIVDLEHVIDYWGDWRAYEALVSGPTLGTQSSAYINRMLQLIRIDGMWRELSGSQRLWVPTDSLVAVVESARTFATTRLRSPSGPSATDLLFSVCNYDSQISKMLQDAGLQLEKLKRAVDG